MNFYELKTKIMLENFLETCKKYEITAKDIDNIELLWRNKNYILNEVGFSDFLPPVITKPFSGARDFAGRTIQKGLEKVAGFGYKRGLNQILKQTQAVLNQLNQSSTNVEKLIQTYKLDDDKAAKEILSSLKNLQEPYKQLQTKVTGLQSATALGLRGGAIEGEESPEGVNLPLIKNMISKVETEFDKAFPVAGSTDQTKQNRILLTKTLDKYFKAIDPSKYELALKSINKSIAKSTGNDAKMYAFIADIAKKSGQTNVETSPKPKSLDKATIDRWAADLERYIKDSSGTYLANPRISQGFINAYKKFLKVSDPANVQGIHSNLATKLQNTFAASPFNAVSAEQLLRQQTSILSNPPRT
jgi:DNA repair exonuclease SbcCD ATPase subunit